MSLVLRGFLKGHDGWVTTLATTAEKPNTLISGSRDKTLMVWNLTRDAGQTFGLPLRSLEGHSHFVQDVVVSSDGQFALSASWDATIRLWDLSTGQTTRRFVSHSKDVLSVAFSADNRQIVSGARDKTVKLWNTLGECKYTIADGHSEWVSAVRFSPNVQKPTIVSAGWDKLIKVWDMSTLKLRTTLVGHTGPINTITVSPDGSLCASAGKDGQVILWDLTEGKYLYSLTAGSAVNALAFSPNRYWLAAATANGVKVWDLENQRPIAEITKASAGFFPTDEALVLPENSPRNPVALSLAWSVDGANLFVGYTDNLIRVLEVLQ